MLIQLNTDNHVDGRDEAMRDVQTDLYRRLSPYSGPAAAQRIPR